MFNVIHSNQNSQENNMEHLHWQTEIPCSTSSGCLGGKTFTVLSYQLNLIWAPLSCLVSEIELWPLFEIVL